MEIFIHLIVIVSSRFLQRPKCWNQHSQALIQDKIDRQRVRSRESDRQTAMVDDGWLLELRRGGRYGEEDESG